MSERANLGFSLCNMANDTELRVTLPGGAYRWIPRNQLHPDSEVKNIRDKGQLVVNRDWAKKAGLV